MRLLIILGLALSATPAAAQDMPARKAGLWEMTMTFEAKIPSMTVEERRERLLALRQKAADMLIDGEPVEVEPED